MDGYTILAGFLIFFLLFRFHTYPDILKKTNDKMMTRTENKPIELLRRVKNNLSI